MRLDAITHLTFDCYGTLIDWEQGILDAVRPVLMRHGAMPEDGDILRAFVDAEAALEAGIYRPYREVLREAMRAIGRRFGRELRASECEALPASLPHWQPFPDSVAALAQLRRRFTLTAVTNCDDDLFAASARLLGDPFTHVVTAQQVGSYKPAHDNFATALAALNVPVARVMHVAQSLWHDHVPAQHFGLATCHVDRPTRLTGTGLAPPASVTPTLTVGSMAELAAHLEAPPVAH